jgi:glycosyltransferase involved in cell wall biosynthesis
VELRRILLLITDLEIGGTPTVVRELAIRLRDTAAAPYIHVACLAKWGPVADQLKVHGIPVTALGARGSRDLRVLPRFIRLLREQHIDTVFSFLIHANAVAAAASLWVHGIHWIQSVQTTQPWPKWHWMLQHLVAGAAERVVVPSPSVAEAAAAWAGIPREKIAIIPNAVDPANFKTSSVPNDNPRIYPITFIGRLDPIKDVPTLIAAVAAVDRPVHLHIYGAGEDRRRIDEEIERQDLSYCVTLHGTTEHPQTALAESGLLVLPSLAEGFGLVLIEAMAAGVPIVATNVPGIRNVIRDGQTGLLVPPRNPHELAKAIRRVIDDPDLRRRLIERGKLEVQRRFTWDIVLDQYRAVLHLSPASP